MSPPEDAPLIDEPWEAEIGALLGGLPPIDPPAGFIATALDHRPLHSGRTMAVLATLVVTVVGLALALGSAEASLALPEIDWLTQRHVAAQADLDLPLGDTDTSGTDEAPDVLVDGYERRATFTLDDLRQAVYEREGEAVSVFLIEGRPDWERLPPPGRTTLGGNDAWVDDDLLVTIVQAGEETIAVVGLVSTEVSSLIDRLPAETAPTAADPATDLVSRVVSQLGFPAG